MYVLPAARVNLGALGQDDIFFDEPYYDEPVYAPSAPAPIPSAGGGTDWTGIIGTAIKTWGSIEQTQAQAEAQRAYFERAPLSPYNTRPLPTAQRYPGYSPFPGSATGGGLFSGTTGLLMLAALGVGAYYMMR